MKTIEDVVTFNELNWDTEFFGVTSAKVVLHRPLTLNEWAVLKTKLRSYQFISIVNKNSEPVNAQLVGKDTAAFLADVNLQFEKKPVHLDTNEKLKNVTIHQAMERNDQVVNLAKFHCTKFTEDPELAKRGGDQVYRHWVINSFGKPDKFYALSREPNGDINGFVLYSYSDNVCIIELLAVSQKEAKSGIGTNLFKAIECVAYQKGTNKIKVGTQIRNMAAINFYQKCGCKQVECHQVYHLWNL